MRLDIKLKSSSRRGYREKTNCIWLQKRVTIHECVYSRNQLNRLRLDGFLVYSIFSNPYRDYCYEINYEYIIKF